MVSSTDNTTVVAETEDLLQRQQRQFYLNAQKFNIEISIQNTKCLTIDKNPLRCKIVIGDKPFEREMRFELK